jgi:phosphoribosylaminoimidazolecarboxamide formyltransferase/IMP cyclohydrolase
MKGIAMALNYVTTVDDQVRIRNVIVSVYDKSGLAYFIPGIMRINPECRFFATGNSYQHIKGLMGNAAKKNLIAIADFTGQPEMQGGLVKTLDFKIYLGLLSETYNTEHNDDIKRVGGVLFDMVVSNLYPFSETIGRADATPEMARANIDIGGPCMIRAAAKNFHRVTVVTDKNDYRSLLDVLENSDGMLDIETRLTLARKAFLLTAQYDALIAEYLVNIGSEAVKRCYEFPKKGA